MKSSANFSKSYMNERLSLRKLETPPDIPDFRKERTTHIYLQQAGATAVCYLSAAVLLLLIITSSSFSIPGTSYFVLRIIFGENDITGYTRSIWPGHLLLILRIYMFFFTHKEHSSLAEALIISTVPVGARKHAGYCRLLVILCPVFGPVFGFSDPSTACFSSKNYYSSLPPEPTS